VARRDFPRGHPNDPLSDDEMRAKFLRCAQERLDTARARRLLAMLERVESVGVREILSAATPGAA
jgi:2-methylcitrate dehydratase PrpD